MRAAPEGKMGVGVTQERARPTATTEHMSPVSGRARKRERAGKSRKERRARERDDGGGSERGKAGKER